MDCLEEGGLTRSESLVTASAYWEDLLREPWRQLQREEAEALARSLAEQRRLAEAEAEGLGGANLGLAGGASGEGRLVIQKRLPRLLVSTDVVDPQVAWLAGMQRMHVGHSELGLHAL